MPIALGPYDGGRGSLEAKTAIYKMQEVLEMFEEDPVSCERRWAKILAKRDDTTPPPIMVKAIKRSWGLWNAMVEKKERGERLFNFLAYFSSPTLLDEMRIFQ